MRIRISNYLLIYQHIYIRSTPYYCYYMHMRRMTGKGSSADTDIHSLFHPLETAVLLNTPPPPSLVGDSNSTSCPRKQHAIPEAAAAAEVVVHNQPMVDQNACTRWGNSRIFSGMSLINATSGLSLHASSLHYTHRTTRIQTPA